jgi:hypothetical protein
MPLSFIKKLGRFTYTPPRYLAYSAHNKGNKYLAISSKDLNSILDPFRLLKNWGGSPILRQGI